MASTKEIFAKGLCYMLREEQDLLQEYTSGLNYYKIIAKKYGNSDVRARKRLLKIQGELEQIKLQLDNVRKDYDKYLKEYSYTQEDLEKYNIHPSTDEELEQDYINDLKEVDYNKSYTKENHDTLVSKVHEFNLLNGLPIVNW